MRQTNEIAAEAAGLARGGPCPGLLPVECEPRDHDHVSSVTLCEAFAMVRTIDSGTEIVQLVDYSEFEGLVITMVEGPHGEQAAIELRHSNPDRSAILFRVADDHDIPDLLHAWTVWGGRLNVRRFVEMPDGGLCPPPSEMQCSKVLDCAPAPRRSYVDFRSRRPQMPGCRLGRHQFI